MRYVDSYVIPVPKKNLAAYRRMAQKMGKIWKKCGALKYIEAAADDVQKGKWTSFPQSVKKKPGETIILGYVVYKSRAHRDSVRRKAWNHPQMKGICQSKSMPFDGKRMFWGGFKTFIDS